MAIQEKRLKNIEDILNAKVPLISGTLVYRGVNNSDYKLIPSVGRWTGKESSRLHYERQIFDEFKKSAIGYLSYIPRTEWEWLFLAQHHGLPTRLLDWTTSPLIALFFALIQDKPNIEHDYAVYQAPFAQVIPTEPQKFLGNDPLRVNGTALVHPSFVSPRVETQSSVFSIQQDPWNELVEPNEITKFVFPKESRTDGLRKLAYYGIKHSLLFPGLDSLAKDIVFKHDTKFNYLKGS